MSVRSLFVPTPEVEKYTNYYLVQLMAKERIRCIMKNETFSDIAPSLVERYLTLPPAVQTADAIKKYCEAEGKIINKAFKEFEKTPAYVNALEQLNPYKGNPFEITSVTSGGIMVLIEVPEPVSA
jgi:hypothetical protein